MKITLIGAGCGTADTLTRQALAAIQAAQLLLGARRLLDGVDAPAEKIPAVYAREIADQLAAHPCDRACVLLSGDSGFYSGARRLLPLLKDYDVAVLPGVSSVQALAARLGRPWQDWGLYSAHGVDCDPVAAVCAGKPAFFLTGGAVTPAALCAALAEAGLGFLPAVVGENLFCPNERILRASVSELAAEKFAPLSVLLCDGAPRRETRTPGIPDGEFLRAEKVPMTKRLVRAAALSLLAVSPADVCWDIGAGTGSVSVELALHARAVWAVERRADALEIAQQNREKFGAWNLRLVSGTAPEALPGLPKPDAVFVGGSGGRMAEILRAVRAANPEARVCVAAIALESLHAAVSALEALGYAVEVTQLQVSESRPAGALHMMCAQNPVYLILGAAK